MKAVALAALTAAALAGCALIRAPEPKPLRVPAGDCAYLIVDGDIVTLGGTKCRAEWTYR